MEIRIDHHRPPRAEMPPVGPGAPVTLRRQVSLALLVLAALVTWSSPAPASSGSLSEDRIIDSKILEYALQYRVYTPEAPGPHPVLYVTDGQLYIERGALHLVLDDLIVGGEIEPVIAVFVDNRDPHDLGVNRRNQQFFCSREYAEFFVEELVPEIDRAFPTTADREGRTILGLSFGGLNSACFGLLAHETFGGIAMQSPALHPVPDIHRAWQQMPPRSLRVFLSTGTRRDNEASTRRLREILDDKGYDLHYVEVDEGHTWRNWQPLLDDVARNFFAPRSTGH